MRFILFSLLIFSGLMFTSCSGDGEGVEDLVAVGGKQYGGEFSFMSSEKITSVLPTSCADKYSSRIVSQIYEPLLTIDETSMKSIPCLAESFKVSDDAKVYTFKIRKGVKFHEDDCIKDGREVNANDVKFSLDMACSGLEVNHIAYLLVNRIKGGAEFNEKSTKKFQKGGVSGIKVLDDYTVEITLVNSFAGFENILTHPSLGIFPQEAWDTYGEKMKEHAVGTGAFMLESMSNEKIVLKRNNDYWRKDSFGNQLPFLSKVTMTYVKDKRSEIMAFRKSESDLVLEIPVEEIEHILGTLKEAQEGKNVKHKVESDASMSITYVAMSLDSDEFSDIKVRQAFNMAVDRDAVVDEWLEGEGWPASNGFVPSSVKNYPAEKVKGHSYNPEKAKSLMAQAGYPGGKNFPELDFYVNALEGSTMHKMSQAIAQQLKGNLGVKLNIKLCTIEERLQAIAEGKAKIWRAGWIADYPDPENFLAMFYGGNITNQMSMMNRFKFQDDEYDKLYEQAIVEADFDKRMELYLQCDQLVIDKAALMPVLTDDHVIMINARVRDFKTNSLETMNLSEVFIKEPKTDSKK
jgi:peptide/nickel transport system substrate-binding protein